MKELIKLNADGTFAAVEPNDKATTWWVGVLNNTYQSLDGQYFETLLQDFPEAILQSNNEGFQYFMCRLAIADEVEVASRAARAFTIERAAQLVVQCRIKRDGLDVKAMFEDRLAQEAARVDTVSG